MNIIYLHSHDTGRYIQPYGYAIPTPHMQHLAAEGVLYRQAFCANPTCSPSRACLLTGQWAHACGMGGLVNRGWTLPVPEHLMMHTLRRAGYTTAIAGFQHVVRDIAEAGYSRLLHQENKDLSTEERAAAFLAESHNAPFFLDVGFSETHRKGPGFDPQPEGELPTDPRFVRPPAPFPDTPETRQDMAAYIDAARRLDQKVGHVLQALEDSGQKNNTLVICTTDHGLAFPNMKCHLTDHGTGVMLLMRGPGGFSGGKVIDALVSQLDLFPTLCELADIAAPEWLQGTSLVPLIRGQVETVHQELFAEVNYHCCYQPRRMVRTHRWKYIRRFDQRCHPVLPDCDDSLSKDFLVRQGWRQQTLEAERLYDLVFDPHEAYNLATDPNCGGVLEEMRGRLQRWQRQTDDPILTGIFVPPPTAKINDPDEYSPRTAAEVGAREFLGLI